jgi:predicted DNA-binding transcriptional regulator YafY
MQDRTSLLKARAPGAEMVRAWSDKELGSVTNTAFKKVESVLQDKLKKEIEIQAVVVPSFQIDQSTSENFELTRGAIDMSLKLDTHYSSKKGETAQRVIWPCLLHIWGST